MRLGPGSRETGAGGLMEEDKPRGVLMGLATPDTGGRRTLWGPRVFVVRMVDVESDRGAGLSLAWTRTLRGPSIDFPVVFVVATAGLIWLSVAD